MLQLTTWGKTGVSCDNLPLLFPSVFKRFVLQTHKNQGLFGKGLNLSVIIEDVYINLVTFVSFPKSKYKKWQVNIKPPMYDTVMALCNLELSLKISLLLTLSQRNPGFTCLQYKFFGNTVGKGDIAHNEHFLLFPQYFLPFW